MSKDSSLESITWSDSKMDSLLFSYMTFEIMNVLLSRRPTIKNG